MTTGSPFSTSPVPAISALVSTVHLCSLLLLLKNAKEQDQGSTNGYQARMECQDLQLTTLASTSLAPCKSVRISLPNTPQATNTQWNGRPSSFQGLWGGASDSMWYGGSGRSSYFRVESCFISEK
ncbi:uncharacterized protein N7483_000180 [Penicillium malachiteum]|uniref:uncharacterized protein n=1 Tax=Penicillium malachiteum TaxID=1324776 RepID=UPI002547E85C|nr:uncharacterized protein N7483_000180 [Penicillium malachiteum]KAJ5735055.1 hypothetical protein N7483_000180 [Penicillium malachiteum]